MTTPRHEISWEELPQLTTAIQPDDEVIVHDRTDGREKRAPAGSLPSTSRPNPAERYYRGTTPPPGDPIVGDRWYDTSDDTYRIWNGSIWGVIGPHSGIDATARDLARNAQNTADRKSTVEINPADEARAGTATTVKVDNDTWVIGGGSDVEANPIGAASARLRSLGVDGIVYGVDEVVANPTTDESTPTLSSVEIDGTSYVLPGGGSGGAVTQGDLTTERNAREAGDAPDFSIVTTSAQLRDAIAAAGTSDNPHILLVSLTAPVEFIESPTHGTGRLRDGQLVYLSPRSTAEEIGPRFVQHKNLSYTFHEVSDATTFNNLVTAQRSNPTHVVIESIADFTASIQSIDTPVHVGELWHIAPYGTVPNKFLDIQDALDRINIGEFRVYTTTGNVGISATTDLDGDYWVEVKNLPSRLSTANRFTINVAEDDGTILGGTNLHDQSGWTYSKDFGFTLNVSGTEEAQARVQSALATTPGYANLVLRFWNNNVNIGDNIFHRLPINSVFTEASGGGLTPMQEQQIEDANVTFWVPGFGAGIETARNISIVMQQLAGSYPTATKARITVGGFTLGTTSTFSPTTLRQTFTRSITANQMETINTNIGLNVGNHIEISVILLDASDAEVKVFHLYAPVNPASGGGGGGLPAPTSRALTLQDRLVYVVAGAPGVLRYATTGVTNLVDTFRSNMAVATSTTKGLLSAALFNKLNGLPDGAGLTTLLGRKQDTLPTLGNDQFWKTNSAGTLQASDINLGDSVIRFGNPTDLTANPVEDGVILAFGNDPLKLYVPHFKELILRDVEGSDFRVGSYTWGGIHSGPSNPAGNIPAGRVYFTFTAFGAWTARSFYVSQGGGGWAALANNHEPATWSAYNDQAEADKAVNDVGRVVLIADGNRAGVTQRIDGARWVLLSRPDEVRTIVYGTEIEFNANKSHIQEVTLTGNTTLSMINGEDGGTALLRITQDSTGGRTIAFDATITGTAPTLSIAGDRTDLLCFHKIGNNWHYITEMQNV